MKSHVLRFGKIFAGPRWMVLALAGLAGLPVYVQRMSYADPSPTTSAATTLPTIPMPIAPIPTTAPIATTMAVESMDDLRYPAWNKFKVNSNSTLAGDVIEQGVPVHLSMTQTLTAVNADNVQVETKFAVTFMGTTHDAAPQTDAISAKTDKQQITDGGTRDIQANGRTYTCKVLDVASEKTPGVKRTVFINNDVPGGVVEMDVTDPAGKTMKLKLTAADVK